ncbi:hypothetical protein [Paenibacillus glacialis]|uniref:hypothetical protein n=1 Tax=Paenibacillus glacialis TaxID=494026 RepID=UPI000AC48DD8|nr:hypothetical protein [Paenibacillus glacialis]
MKIKPEQKKEDLKLDVKGNGCWSDCHVYYANNDNSSSCRGWDWTSHDNILY